MRKRESERERERGEGEMEGDKMMGDGARVYCKTGSWRKRDVKNMTKQEMLSVCLPPGLLQMPL